MPLDTLVIDAGPLLTATPQSISSLSAQKLCTTPDVLAEVRSKTSRDLLTDAAWAQNPLKARQPSPEALVRVSLFAKATGDIAVLSATDLGLCALVLTIEVEAHGWHRVRPSFGVSSAYEIERRTARKLERQAKAERKRQQKQSVDVAPGQDQSTGYNSAVVADNVPEAAQISEGAASSSQKGDAVQSQNASSSHDDSSDGEGEWITPENFKSHKAKSMHLPEPLEPEAGTNQANLSTACLTGDFAMQNVLMQMGLNVLGPDGQRIKDVRTWVLRCHACYKLCKNPTEKFCPSCGNPSLMRTSITYLPEPTAEHPKGYILHLKKNFQYNNRGTVFSLPSPWSKGSASKKQSNDVYILRPDQKEWLRGKRTRDIQQAKEEKRALKAENSNRGVDSEWIPEMLLGDKGRPRGASSNDKGIRLGKDGLPIIGAGRKNPNIARKRI